jgi:O-antigen ligase
LSNQLSQLNILLKFADNILSILLLGFLLLELLIDGEKKIHATPLNYILLLYVISILISTVQGGPFNLLKLFTTILKYLALFFIVVNFYNTKRRIIFLMLAFLSVTILSAMIGIVQETFYLLKGSMLLGSIPKSSQKMFFEVVPVVGRILRVPAFFPSPQRFAETLMVCISISVYFLFDYKFTNRKNRIFLFLATILLMITLSMTFVRAAFLGVFLALFLLPFLKKPSWAIHYVCIVLFFGTILYFSGIFDYSLSKYSLGDVGYRVNLMQSTIEGLITENPFLGVGIDRGFVYHPNMKNWPVHNAFLLTWVESGLIGFLSYCSLVVLLLIRLLRVIWSGNNGPVQTLAKAVLLGFVALIVYINGDPSPHDSLNWMLFGVIESIVQIHRAEQTGHDPS